MNIKPISEIRAFMESIAQPMDIEIVDVEWNDRSAELTVFIDTEFSISNSAFTTLLKSRPIPFFEVKAMFFKRTFKLLKSPVVIENPVKATDEPIIYTSVTLVPTFPYDVGIVRTFVVEL